MRGHEGRGRLLLKEQKAPRVLPPPEDPDAERSLIGAVLLDPSYVVPRVLRHVHAADFTRWQHRLAMQAIELLYEREDAIDSTTVAGEMNRIEPQFDRATRNDQAFLVGCMEASPTHLHAEGYARRVRYCATGREILNAANEMAVIAYGRSVPEDDQTADRLLANAIVPLERLIERRGGGSRIVSMAEASAEYYDTLGRRMDQDPAVIGEQLGIPDTDELAYRPGEFWLVAAESGVGKTAFMGTQNDLLGDREVATLFVSIEQPMDQLMDRIVAGAADLDSWDLARGKNVDLFKVTNALTGLTQRRGTKSFFVDNGTMNTAELEALVQFAVVRHGIKVVFVDYVQLLNDQVGDGGLPEKFAYISGRLRQIARRHRITVVGGSQLSREGKLRWAGELDQDSFVILRLTRDKKKPWLAKLKVEKNRNSRAGREIDLMFDQKTAHFYAPATAATSTLDDEPDQKEIPF